MNDKSKYSLLLKYGPNEEEIFNFIKNSDGNTNVNGNRSEIIKRGLAAFQYIVQINELEMMTSLSKKMKEIHLSYKYEDIIIAESLALAIFASMICKKGMLESELFGSIVINLKEIKQYLYPSGPFTMSLQSPELEKLMDHLIKSIDLIFLKKDLNSIVEEKTTPNEASYWDSFEKMYTIIYTKDPDGSSSVKTENYFVPPNVSPEVREILKVPYPVPVFTEPVKEYGTIGLERKNLIKEIVK